MRVQLQTGKHNYYLFSVFAVVEPVLMDLVVGWLPLFLGDSKSFTSHVKILRRLCWLAVVPECCGCP